MLHVHETDGAVRPVVAGAGAGVVEAAPVGGATQALEGLMRQALDVPGAAAALLEAFAVQARALRLVQEAEARGAASLPAELRQRLAAAAATTPAWLAAGEGLRA